MGSLFSSKAVVSPNGKGAIGFRNGWIERKHTGGKGKVA